MNSLKEIVVDILVTIFIAVAVWLHNPWMWWVIAIYTLILFIAKGYVLYSDGFLQESLQKQDEAEWVLHILYALNIILLGIATWWYPAALWVLIWLFSYIGKLKREKK